MSSSRGRFKFLAERSAVLIEARSNVGPITFGTISIDGYVEASVDGGAIDLEDAPTGELVVELEALRSGNPLYDAELLRRVDVRQYPRTVVALGGTRRIGTSERFELQGELTFHGVTRVIQGSVAVSVVSDDEIEVSGEHVFDIRDFNVVAPTVLMLRIYPDVRVQLQLAAMREAS